MKPYLMRLLIYGSLVLVFTGLYVAWFLPRREPARRESCASNLKQLSLAASMYAGDYDGRFPLKPHPGGDWMAWQWSTWPASNHLDSPSGGPLYPYTKSFCIGWCPSDRSDDKRAFKASPRSSYLWNDALCGKLIEDCNDQPLVWDREPWHNRQRNVSYLTKGGNPVVRLVP